MSIEDFINEVYYDSMGQMILSKQKDGDNQLLLNVRAWGTIVSMFIDNPNEAAIFHDGLGEWVADAINAKVKGVTKKVKPLEWNGRHSASGIDGHYSVFKDNSGKWRWHFFFLEETMDSMMSEDSYDTMQDAQNAANANYEQQVLSLLEL